MTPLGWRKFQTEPLPSQVVPQFEIVTLARSHPERARLFARQEPGKSNDLYPRQCINAVARSYGAPSHGSDRSVVVGVLRLRGCFASRSSYCAQDDSPVKGHTFQIEPLEGKSPRADYKLSWSSAPALRCPTFHRIAAPGRTALSDGIQPQIRPERQC